MTSCSVLLLPAGDILLNVNGVDLTGVTRSEAVTNLKNTSSPVVLKVLEMRSPEESLQECTLPPCLTNSPTDSTKSLLSNDDYSPLWVSWLQLPRWSSILIHIHVLNFSLVSFSSQWDRQPHAARTDLGQLGPSGNFDRESSLYLQTTS